MSKHKITERTIPPNPNFVWVVHRGYKWFGLSNEPAYAECFRSAEDARQEVARRNRCGLSCTCIHRSPPKSCNKIWEPGEQHALIRSRTTRQINQTT